MAKSIIGENPTIEQFQEQVRRELDEIVKVWTPSNIRSFVQNKLEGKAFEIAMGALGFTHSFGRWEIRSQDRSPAMKAILDDAQDEIVTWVAKQIELMPALPKKTLVSIQSEYKEAVYRQLREIMLQRARTEAHRLADQLCLGLTDDNSDVASEFNMPEA